MTIPTDITELSDESPRPNRLRLAARLFSMKFCSHDLLRDLLAGADPQALLTLTDAVFGDVLDQPDLRGRLLPVIAAVRDSGSLRQAADTLQLSPNGFRARVEVLRRYTSLDVRCPGDGLLLDLALTAWELRVGRRR